MSSDEETCDNVSSLNAFRIESLCDTCKHRPSCSYAYASDLIAERKMPGTNQDHITDECFGYKKVLTLSYRGEEVHPDHPDTGNLQPRLWEAKVKDPCPSCPFEVKNNCDRRQRLDELSDISVKSGTWVKSLVISCNRPERLFQIRVPSQISEPKRSL